MIAVFASVLLAAAAPAEERWITLGGTVTEIVHALGGGERVVAVDDSSIYPAAAKQRPKVGYYRSIGAEGVLSLRPTRVVGTAEAGPPGVLEQLRAAGVKVELLDPSPTVEAARARIHEVAALLGSKDAGDALVARLDSQLKEAAAKVACVREKKPKVAFVMARGGRAITAAGSDTAADSIISLAGGQNAFGLMKGYKAVSAEATVQAGPEVILTTTATMKAVGGEGRLLDQAGLSLTPAGRGKRVVVVDDLLLLGFGPRLGEAVSQVASGFGGGACGG